MKILFLHLSDLHIKTEEALSKTHIDKILDTLRMYGAFDRMILILSGDIAFSGNENQYKVANSLVERIIQEIKRKDIYSENVEIVCVPGNHDIEYETPPRSSDDLNKIYDEFSYDRHLTNELEKQNCFFEFSKRNGCFSEKSVFDRRIINIDGFAIEVNMVNSAVFSLKHNEDKGLHYIDQDAINTINTPSGADFVISIMHHAPEWYIDAQKEQLETALLCKSSLIFLGHEHRPGTKNCSYNDGAAAFIHAGGSLCHDSNWINSEFGIGVLNTDTLEYIAALLKWNESEHQYEVKDRFTRELPSKPSIEKILTIQESYRKELFSVAHRSFSDSSQDYYVFPRIEPETYEENETREFVELEEFVNEIQEQKRVLVTGANNYGKSLLLKNLFLRFSQMGKCVILCDIDTIRRKESSKILKTNFEDIYGEDFSDYTRFLQMPPENKVLIIDDIDQIKQHDFENYIAGVADQFGLMVFATKDIIDFDMLQRMKTALKSENSVAKYKIMPFFADKRRELVEKLVTLRSKKDPSIPVSDTVETLCESITLQKKYIALEPEFIINFVEYYCNNMGSTLSSDSTVFSKVFEANITTSLAAFKTKELSVDKLYKLLSMLARHIHFKKMYPIAEQEIISIVDAYNDEFDDVVKPLSFLDIVKKSKILVSDSEGYKFANRNHLAYFCAREVNFLYNATGDEADLRYLIEYCCFGINADILMFISYITDNTKILKLLLTMTRTLTEGWKEFDFKENCPSFLNFSYEDNEPAPSQDSKRQQEVAEVESEKAVSDKLQTIDIYDYKEEDIVKTINQLTRSVSLLAIIAKCLPSFEHNMNGPMRKDFVNELYSLPNKIYYLWAKETDEVYGELIEYLKEQESAEYQKQGSRKKVDVDLKFKLVASLILLDIYSIAVNYATRENSFRLLDKFPRTNITTYEIQNLMMVMRQKMSDRFVGDAIALHRKCDRDLPKFLTKSIVRHAYISMKSLDFKLLNKLNSEFYQVGRRGKKRSLKMEKTMMIKRSQKGKDRD